MNFKAVSITVLMALAAAEAGAVTYDLEVNLSNGRLGDGPWVGTVTWDETLVPNVGIVELTRTGAGFSFETRLADPTLDIDLDVGPGSVNASMDIGAPNWPLLRFANGVLEVIDFSVDDLYTPFNLAAFGLREFSFDTRSPVIVTGSTVTASASVTYADVAAVPLPASLFMMIGALGAVALARRKTA